MYAVNEKEGKPLGLPGRDVTVMIGADKVKSNRITLGTTVVPPKTNMTPHVHINKEEVVYVIEGNGEVQIGDVVEPMTPNTAVVFPENVEHAVRNTSDKPLKFVFIFNPTHDFDGRI